MTTPTPAAAGPSEGKEDRKRSLGKYVKRMSSVFKRDKSTKSSASSTPATPATPASPSTPLPKVDESKEVAPAAVAPAPKETAPAPAPASKETTTKTTTAVPATTKTTTTASSPPPPTAPVQHINRNALQQERARALFAKYGLTLESHEWITPPSPSANVQRVEKPIRMRVHRSCHFCGTTYGTDKVCSNCEHKRCKKCPRYPKKKSAAEKGKEAAEDDDKHRKKKMLAVHTKNGEERVYQPVKQRVRRTCHRCSTLFIPPTATRCENCNHERCTKCPREPAKLHKWPNGYPGDAEPGSDTEVDAARQLEMRRRIWRKPRTRVRWECEECHSLFLEGSPLCPGCGHERCEKCSRTPLKRVKKERDFDPEVVRNVEAKLRALAVEQEDRPPALSAEAT